MDSVKKKIIQQFPLTATDSAVHELTLLLATGKPSPPLSIYLARCDLTSERVNPEL